MLEIIKTFLVSTVWDNGLFRLVTILTNLGFFTNLIVRFYVWKKANGKEEKRLGEADKDLKKINEAMITFLELGYKQTKGKEVEYQIKSDYGTEEPDFDYEKCEEERKIFYNSFYENISRHSLQELANAINSMKLAQITFDSPRLLVTNAEITKEDKEKWIKRVNERWFYHFFGY